MQQLTSKQNDEREEFLSLIEGKITLNVSSQTWYILRNHVIGKTFLVIRNGWRYVIAKRHYDQLKNLNKLFEVLEQHQNHPGFNWEMILMIINPEVKKEFQK